MVARGENDLRGTLTTSDSTPQGVANATTAGSGLPVPPPNVPAAERGAQAQAEIDEASRRARDGERRRLQNGPPVWWGNDPGEVTGGTGAQGPGGYTFDAKTIAAKITQWEKVREDIAKDGANLEQAASALSPPSPDQPAEQQVLATRASINAAYDHNRTMQQYAQAYIDALKKANGTYVRHEDNTAAGLTGGGPPDN